MTQILNTKMKAFVQWMQGFAHKGWYLPLLTLLAAIDNFVVVIPTDGILVSSSMLQPRRWIWFALSIAIGSTIGASLLAHLVEIKGLPWVLEIYPGIESVNTWQWTVDFFDRYGLFVVFGMAITPFFQQPAVILAAVANTPLIELAAVTFLGRALKFLLISYLGSHVPRLLGKMWGLKGELKDVGIKLEGKP